MALKELLGDWGYLGHSWWLSSGWQPVTWLVDKGFHDSKFRVHEEGIQVSVINVSGSRGNNIGPEFAGNCSVCYASVLGGKDPESFNWSSKMGSMAQSVCAWADAFEPASNKPANK